VNSILSARSFVKNKIQCSRLHRRDQSGILRVIDDELAFEAPGELIAEVDVEPLIAAAG
jgi:hypothetical protein